MGRINMFIDEKKKKTEEEEAAAAPQKELVADRDRGF